uniref:AIG1-type G domain-containing protein n=1 Tax=Salix viminalis TaxID=40686 RepID=A0A6N2K804_SALVM
MSELERRLAFYSPSGTEVSDDHSRKIDEKITADSDEVDTVQEQLGKELVDSPSAAWVSHDYSNQRIIADPDEEVDMVKEKNREESFDSPSGRIDEQNIAVAGVSHDYSNKQITADPDEEADIVIEKKREELSDSTSRRIDKQNIAAVVVSHDYSNQRIIADPDEEVDMVKEKSSEESFDSPSGRIDEKIIVTARVSHDFSNHLLTADPDEEADTVKEKSREASFDSTSGRIAEQIVPDADEEGKIITEKMGNELFDSPSWADVSHERSHRTKKQIITDSDEDTDIVEEQMGRELADIVQEQMEKELFDSLSGVEVSHDHPQSIHERIIADSDEEVDLINEQIGEGLFDASSGRIDGQVITDSDSEGDVDSEQIGNDLLESDALAALLKAASSAGLDGGRVALTSADGSRVFSLERLVGSDSPFRIVRSALLSETIKDVAKNGLNEEDKKVIEKIQQITVKFLRLVQRLGQSPEDSMVAQVLHRLVMATRAHVNQEFSLENAEKMAMQLEAEGKDDLDFSLNILVLGKTGVGKSATINSIFGEKKVEINAFEPATTMLKEVVGIIDGVKIRIIDTPGLRSSMKEEAINRKILASIKTSINKFPPDVVLYTDRLDTHSIDLNDLPMLRLLTKSLTSSIWKNSVVTLTHATSPPPDGPSGSPLSFEMFIGQRSHAIQQAISQAVGDLRLIHPRMMHPVSLVENHPLCQMNENSEHILPNGQSWRSQLLLLCYSLKILSEASSLAKPRDPFDHKKPFGFHLPSLPLPHLVSSLLQSRPHPKLPADQGGDNVDSNIDWVDLSDSDEEIEDEYDQLPPFKPLKKSHVVKLTKEQRKAYLEEYDYRVKLLQKKQWQEEVKRLKEMKKKGKDGYDDIGEDVDQEDVGPATVPVAMPDFVLPPSFDSDNPSYRYRALEPTSQILVRPVLDSNGWDHDCGYDGVSLERNLVVAGQFPGAFAVQITKDKKDFNIHLDSSVCAKHGENGSTMAGFDIQNVGRQLAYILRSETKFKNFKMNKTSAGISFTLLGENVATGLKIEDQIAVAKHLALVGAAGAVRSGGDTAYGANFEVCLKSKDFPVEQDQSTLGLSLMKWRGDLGLMANLQSQFSIGRNSKMVVRVGINNKRSGQITVKTSSSEMQVALIAIVPMVTSLFRSIYNGYATSNSHTLDY